LISQLSYPEIIIAVLLTIVFCLFTWYKKWLTKAGAFLATIIGIAILIAGGFKLSIPILLFFITGSLFDKLITRAEIIGEKDKKPRDFVQVLCNGGIPAICILLFLISRNEVFIAGYFLSISVSMSDTWSSELGVFFNGTVVDITSFRKVPKGISGGISIVGTLAGLAGALIIGILYFLLYQSNVLILFVIAVGGFAGMLLDSIIGSLFQATYKLEDGERTESASAGGILEKGWPIVTNDLVNLLSNIVITLVGLGLMYL
jgi:uncharacterized protein (TIGR00297 family)